MDSVKQSYLNGYIHFGRCSVEANDPKTNIAT